MSQGAHVNSRLANAEGRARGDFGDRALRVLGALQVLGRATDRQVMTHLGFSDPNAVRPRITELIEAGAVVEIAAQIDGKTRKRVRVVALREAGRPGQREFHFDQ